MTLTQYDRVRQAITAAFRDRVLVFICRLGYKDHPSGVQLDVNALRKSVVVGFGPLPAVNTTTR